MRKIINSFNLGTNRFGVTLEIVSPASNVNVIVARLYKDDNCNWVELSVIYGQPMYQGRKIIYLQNEQKRTEFNMEASELKAAEIHTIEWLKSLSYEKIRYLSSLE